MGRKKTQFGESAITNNRTFILFYNRLTELAINSFEWINLPDTCDPRYLELCLFENGQAVFFRDDVVGFLALSCAASGQFDVYNVPTLRRAYAANGYQNDLTNKDSVIIYNNYLRTNCLLEVQQYAKRLYEIQRTIDVNVTAQKTPLLIQCNENQRLTLKNVYMQFSGNEPVIFGEKNIIPDSVKVLNTSAPYVSDKLQILKRQIWNEALTFLGIENSNTEKKERLVTDEINSNLGSVYAQRMARLNARKDACKKINAMFGLNVDVRYNSTFENKIIDEGAEEIG